MLPDDHLTRKLDRLIGGVPEQATDSAPVQGEVDAHLLQRGRHVARDQGLDHARDEDLTRLGELDAIAQHPGLSPRLATSLEAIASKLNTEHLYPSWDERYALHLGHRHAINETCSEDGPGPPPDDVPLITSKIERYATGNGKGPGQGGLAGREQDPESEADKRRKRYWARITKDRPDEDWTPS